MKIHNKLLDKLAHGQTSILVFDCEFWHVFRHKEEGYNYVDDKPFFFMPREIGGLVFSKKKHWTYDNDFFVTMHKPALDVAFPISHYSTVSPQTAHELNELEKELSLPWGEAYYSKLSSRDKVTWIKGVSAYQNDKNIKDHHKPKSWLKEFLELYSNSTVILKGTSDVDALKNACMYYGYKYKEPLHVVDIAEWNPLSYRICQTAKLEGTFDCIRNALDHDTRKLLDILPIGNSHDPTVDAAMTLIVALYFSSKK
jgi:hypothetical protein